MATHAIPITTSKLHLILRSLLLMIKIEIRDIRWSIWFLTLMQLIPFAMEITREIGLLNIKSFQSVFQLQHLICHWDTRFSVHFLIVKGYFRTNYLSLLCGHSIYVLLNSKFLYVSTSVNFFVQLFQIFAQILWTADQISSIHCKVGSFQWSFLIKIIYCSVHLIFFHFQKKAKVNFNFF